MALTLLTRAHAFLYVSNHHLPEDLFPLPSLCTSCQSLALRAEESSLRERAKTSNYDLRDRRKGEEREHA